MGYNRLWLKNPNVIAAEYTKTYFIKDLIIRRTTWSYGGQLAKLKFGAVIPSYYRN